MPVWLAMLITFTAMALLATLVFVWVFVAWHPSRGRCLALVMFLAADLALIVTSLLFNTLAGIPSTPALLLRILGGLLVGFLTLGTASAFLLVVVITGRFDQGLVVLMRASLVFWVLFQQPLWNGDLVVLSAQTGASLALRTGQPVIVLGGLILLIYQGLTIGLIVHDRRRFKQPSLAAALVLAQCGTALVVTVPALWEAMAFNWLALPVVVLAGYGILRERCGMAPA